MIAAIFISAFLIFITFLSNSYLIIRMLPLKNETFLKHNRTDFVKKPVFNYMGFWNGKILLGEGYNIGLNLEIMSMKDGLFYVDDNPNKSKYHSLCRIKKFNLTD